MKKIAIAHECFFFEDSEGRLHRNMVKTHLNLILIYILFIGFAIGNLFCIGALASQGEWKLALIPIFLFLLYTAVLIFFFWGLGKAPKLIFDTPVKTMILQTRGNEERLHFDGITRFNIDSIHIDEDTYESWRYNVSVSVKGKEPIHLAEFHGSNKERVSQEVEDFVAYLERITKSNEPRTDLYAKIPPSA